MSSRFSRIAKGICLNPLLACGRKPRIVPMSAKEERDQAELHRRRKIKRAERESRP